MSDVSIIDYGLSNLLSVERACNHLGAHTEIVSDAAGVLAAKRLVLPGVGAFADGMQGLRNAGIIDALLQKTAQGTPLLGICLGMQMLFEESDEFGVHKGLGLIAGRVEKIPETDVYGNLQRVPHVGWQALFANTSEDFSNTVFHGLTAQDEMYFVHSFEAKPEKIAQILACAKYGGRSICAAAQNKNVLGCQFHPEKSGRAGLLVLGNFLKMEY